MFIHAIKKGLRLAILILTAASATTSAMGPRGQNQREVPEFDAIWRRYEAAKGDRLTLLDARKVCEVIAQIGGGWQKSLQASAAAAGTAQRISRGIQGGRNNAMIFFACSLGFSQRELAELRADIAALVSAVEFEPRGEVFIELVRAMGGLLTLTQRLCVARDERGYEIRHYDSDEQFHDWVAERHVQKLKAALLEMEEEFLLRLVESHARCMGPDKASALRCYKEGMRALGEIDPFYDFALARLADAAIQEAVQRQPLGAVLAQLRNDWADRPKREGAVAGQKRSQPEPAEGSSDEEDDGAPALNRARCSRD